MLPLFRLSRVKRTAGRTRGIALGSTQPSGRPLWWRYAAVRPLIRVPAKPSGPTPPKQSEVGTLLKRYLSQISSGMFQ
jgi:hypothetical protein